MSQISNSIKFGTDGWRGIIARDFTFDNVRICAQAVANYLKQSGLDSRGLIVGYDTRFASEDFASASAEVVAGNGIKVYLCPKATPTPVIDLYSVTGNSYCPRACSEPTSTHCVVEELSVFTWSG